MGSWLIVASSSISHGCYSALGSLKASQHPAINGSHGADWRPIFDRGLLGFTCIVSGQALGSWLVVASSSISHGCYSALDALKAHQSPARNGSRGAKWCRFRTLCCESYRIHYALRCYHMCTPFLHSLVHALTLTLWCPLPLSTQASEYSASIRDKPEL